MNSISAVTPYVTHRHPNSTFFFSFLLSGGKGSELCKGGRGQYSLHLLRKKEKKNQDFSEAFLLLRKEKGEKGGKKGRKKRERKK